MSQYSNGHNGFQTLSVAEVAQRLGLKPEVVNDKTEWHGRNPTGSGAGRNGFILFEEGNAWDRLIDVRYKSHEVARMAKLEPSEYQPCAEFRTHHPQAPHSQSAGGLSSGGKSSASPKKKAQSTLEPKQDKPADTRTLQQRGVRDATLGEFRVARVTRSNRSYQDYRCYEYPTFFATGRVGRNRQKSCDPTTTGGQKYFWAGGDKGAMPPGYNLHSIEKWIEQGHREWWVVESEVSTWFCHQAGVPCVNPFGAGRKLPELMRALKTAGVETVHIAFDCDGAGRTGAVKALAASQDADLKATVRKLPGEPNSGFDVADLHERLGSDESAFVRCLRDLPRVGPQEIALWQSGAEAEEEAPPERKSDKSKTTDSEHESTLPADDKPAIDNKKAYEAVANSGKLLQMLEEAELFHTEDDEAYIALPIGDHIETYPLGSSKFESYLAYIWRKTHGKVLQSGVMDNVLAALVADAIWDGNQRQIWNRTAHHDGRIYINLCNERWQVVEIGSDVPGGWQIITNPPVHFRRAKGMEPLPVPQRGGRWESLRPLLNAEDDNNWIMLVSWLVAALRPHQLPYPVLSVHGEQDSGKSNLCRLVRRCVDPNYTLLVGKDTRDERDLAIVAKNSYVLGFDNLSNMKQWFNDALCSLATEGCFRTRKLHSNDEEVIFKARRPMIVNGINENLGQNDLRRRSLKVYLPPWPEERKRDESEVGADFELIWPKILGCICDALAVANEFVGGVELPHRRGLLDFAKWIIAAEPVLPWQSGDFARAYLENQQAAIEAANEASPLTLAIIDYMDQKVEGEKWRGTADELLHQLNAFADDEDRKSSSWPKSVQQIGTMLNRIAPNLRAVGVDFDRDRRPGSGTRLIQLTRRPVGSSQSTLIA